jgi:hypothetical protein
MHPVTFKNEERSAKTNIPVVATPDVDNGILMVKLLKITPGVRLMLNKTLPVGGTTKVSGRSSTLDAIPVWLLIVMDEAPEPGMLLRV